jgi:hypothetical protein
MVTGYKQLDVAGPLKQLGREGFLSTTRGSKRSNNARRIGLNTSPHARDEIAKKYFNPTTDIACYVSVPSCSSKAVGRLTCVRCTAGFSSSNVSSKNPS